jgi:hypothetical protein
MHAITPKPTLDDAVKAGSRARSVR